MAEKGNKTEPGSKKSKPVPVPEKNPSQNLQEKASALVGALPVEAQEIIGGVLSQIADQGQAIINLRTQADLMGKDINQLAGVITQGIDRIAGQGQAAVATNAEANLRGSDDNGGNPRLQQLINIMQLFSGMRGGNQGLLEPGALQALVDQRNALNALMPTSPYEQLATNVGITVMDTFAKNLGVQAIAQVAKTEPVAK